MSEPWWGIAVGASALVIAAVSVAVHYRREYRRQQLLQHLDHHDWWYRTRHRH